MAHEGWLRELAGEVADLRARLGQLESREASIMPPQQVRLCRAVLPPEVYGDGDDWDHSANIVHIVFMDVQFIESHRWDGIPSNDDRQDEDAPIFMAYSISGPVRLGQLLLAFGHNKQWFVAPPFRPIAIETDEVYPGPNIAFRVHVAWDCWLFEGMINTWAMDENQTYWCHDHKYYFDEDGNPWSPPSGSFGFAFWYPVSSTTQHLQMLTPLSHSSQALW